MGKTKSKSTGKGGGGKFSPIASIVVYCEADNVIDLQPTPERRPLLQRLSNERRSRHLPRLPSSDLDVFRRKVTKNMTRMLKRRSEQTPNLRKKLKTMMGEWEKGRKRYLNRSSRTFWKHSKGTSEYTSLPSLQLSS
jgi:hypothetical protein